MFLLGISAPWKIEKLWAETIAKRQAGGLPRGKRRTKGGE